MKYGNITSETLRILKSSIEFHRLCNIVNDLMEFPAVVAAAIMMAILFLPQSFYHESIDETSVVVIYLSNPTYLAFSLLAHV